MRIRYLQNNDARVKEFNALIESKFPTLLDEKNPQLYLVAGGDGAMLRAIHDTIDSQIPYLGKALGTFNFLMNKIDNDEKFISDLISDKVEIETFKTHAIRAFLDGKNLEKL